MVLLFIPIKLTLKYKNSKFMIYCSYAFFKIDVQEEKSKKYQKGEHKNSKNTDDIIKQIPKYIDIFKMILPIIILFFKKIKLEKVHVFAKISSNDAKSCALLYSYVYSIFKNIIHFLDLKSKVQSLKIKTIPDFVSSDSSYSGEIVLSISLLDIFLVLIYGIFVCVKNIKTLRE